MEFTRPFFTGGLDQIGFQSDSRHSHQLDRPQSQAVSHAQRPQHLEVARDQRAEKRHRQLHVPNQHSTNDPTGKRTIIKSIFRVSIGVRKYTFT